MTMRNDSVQDVEKRMSEVQREAIASLVNPMKDQVGNGLGGQISVAGSTLIEYQSNEFILMREP